MRTHSEIYDQDVLTHIVAGMAIELDKLGVADEVVKQFVRGDMQNLRFPTSGRVILFQKISAPKEQLGGLV